MTWEKEKAYTAKKVKEMKKQMEDAITNKDGVTFRRVFKASARYMKRGERHKLMMRYLEATKEEEGNI